VISESLPLLLRAPDESPLQQLLKLAFFLLVFVLPAFLNARKERKKSAPQDQQDEAELAAEAQRQAEVVRQRELEARLREMARRAEMGRTASSEPLTPPLRAPSEPPKRTRKKAKQVSAGEAAASATSVGSRADAFMRTAAAGLGATSGTPIVAKADRSRASVDLRHVLRGSKHSLRTAFLISEVLGKPRGLRQGDSW
jgi:hypothetical protein